MSDNLPTFPADAFTGWHHGSASIEHGGFTFTATLHADDDADAPWDREDGHGTVSDWSTRSKAPGELVLCSDGRSRRFYDFAEACATALRDGWGAPVDPDTYAAKDFPAQTARARAARAAWADFDRLRKWCAGHWNYVGVAVTVTRDVDGEAIDLTGAYDFALWGIESDAGAYLAEVATDLAREALDAARDRAAVIVRELVA